MKIFIWKYVVACSNRFHPGGGVVVFADSEERARDLANKVKGCDIYPNEMPDYVKEVVSDEEKVFIFPDAGCC